MQEERKQTVARVLTLGLGATTAMWVFSYIALRFSSETGQIGGEILFILGALCLPAAARHATTLTEGAWVGIVSALLNLLLVGSIVGGETQSEMMTMGIYWVLGLFIASITLGIFGALLHGKFKDCTCNLDWEFAFIATASTLVFLMLITGGLVTSMDAGLAVPDWPNSYGHNMLLYPFTEMMSHEDGGVFVEHAHRLTGMFVGLTSLIMVVCVWMWRSNKKVWALALGIFLLVCIQGILGGLRVTEINTWFGAIHGVIGQLIFATFVCLAAMFSTLWKNEEHVTNRGDVKWAFALCIAMVLQLVLGAVYRHMLGDESLAPKATHILYTHIAVAFLVLIFAIVMGIRCMHRGHVFLKKVGITLHGLVLLQLLLGGGALVVILINKGETHPLYEILVTTAHQANGALLLGASFITLIWVAHLKRV